MALALSCSIHFDGNPIGKGGETYIRWISSNAELFYINHIGYVGASGAVRVSPGATTDYSGHVSESANTLAPGSSVRVVVGAGSGGGQIGGTDHGSVYISWNGPTPGSKAYTTPGTYTFTVPDYSALTVIANGAGGGGGGASIADRVDGVDALWAGDSSFDGTVIGYAGQGGWGPKSFRTEHGARGADGYGAGGDTNVAGGGASGGAGGTNPCCGYPGGNGGNGGKAVKTYTLAVSCPAILTVSTAARRSRYA